MSLTHPNILVWVFFICQTKSPGHQYTLHCMGQILIDPIFNTINPKRRVFKGAKQTPICRCQCHARPVTSAVGAWESRANSGAQMVHDFFIRHSVCGPKSLNHGSKWARNLPPTSDSEFNTIYWSTGPRPLRTTCDMACQCRRRFRCVSVCSLHWTRT